MMCLHDDACFRSRIPIDAIDWNGRIADLDTSAVQACFTEHGFAVVRGPADSEAMAYGALQNLLYVLGFPQDHERGDKFGICVVREADPSDPAKKIFKGLSPGPLDHHTDGCYLGHCLDDGTAILPPDKFLLQCVRPAASGGETELCDWRSIWRDLSATKSGYERHMLKELRTPQFSACRGKLERKEFPVFEEGPDGAMRVRWHDNIFFPARIESLMISFKRRFLRNPSYGRRIHLQAGDILLINNGRLTHARLDFSDGPVPQRFYHRVYIAADLDRAGDAKISRQSLHGEGDATRYRRLIRPFFSAFTGEPIPGTPLRLPVGLQAI